MTALIRYWLMFAIAGSAISTGAIARGAPGADRFDVYFVAIGSTYYAAPPVATLHGLVTVSGANNSAKSIASRLATGGAMYGVLLTSAESHFVSENDVYAAISAVEKRIKADRPEKPLLIFYFAGHGVSEGIGWNLFAMPGTFLYEGALPGKSVESIAAAAVPAGQVVDRLKSIGVRYLALLDTCSEGSERSFESSVLSGPATESLKNVAAILRFMNEFHQPDPVLFSTKPGTVVQTVADPSGLPGDRVAPLARRIIIALDDLAK